MGIQINGQTDTISAVDGSLSVSGADLTSLSQLKVTGVGTFATLVVSGNASIGGTVTYMDVTNVDSVGIITAQQGLQVLANGINVTGIATVAAGTVSAPSISPTGDSNTGIYFPAADHIAIVEGGTEALRIDSSGNINFDNGSVFVDAVNNRLGVGTTSPAVTAHINSSSAETLRLQHASTPYQSFYLGSNRGAYILSNTSYLEIAAESTSSNTIMFSTSGAEKARLDSSGRLLVGTNSTSASDVKFVAQVGNGTSGPSSGTAPKGIAINHPGGDGSYGGLWFSEGFGDDQGISGIAGFRSADYNTELRLYTNNTNSARSFSERMRLTSNGYMRLGDGTTYYHTIRGAGGNEALEFTANAGQQNASTAGTIKFLNSDTGGAITERMRITNDGQLLAGTTNGTDYSTAAGRIQAVYDSSSATAHCIKAYHLNTSFNESGGGLLFVGIRRSASTAFSFAGWYSGNDSSSITNDREFNFRGDGSGFCDGSWTGGGADYAEYFEWSDANPGEEDRRGISVVLDGDKIREAVAGEDPIGVISGNPSVVGDAAWNKWSGKYLRDEFGTYIQEDYEVEDEKGNTVVQQRRKLNPAYDPDVEYIPREQRPEWDCVGLMGKLRIRKGQVTGSRWVKMRDISDTVEEWLVR